MRRETAAVSGFYHFFQLPGSCPARGRSDVTILRNKIVLRTSENKRGVFLIWVDTDGQLILYFSNKCNIEINVHGYRSSF